MAPPEPLILTAVMDQRKTDNHEANGGLTEAMTSWMKFDFDDEVNSACSVLMP
jgi:hypothetical protein